MRDQKKVFFENLDGLRFFSFLSVFILHSTNSEPYLNKQSWFYENVICHVTINGDLGVNFFFVLSGFLITYLLIEEKKNYGRIDIPSFYVRRLLRIWPLYFLAVFIGYVLYGPVKEYFLHQHVMLNPLRYHLLFISNLFEASHGVSDVGIVNILWSVAIEEQFYLVWPLLVLMFSRSNYYAIISLLIIFVSLLFRYYWMDNGMIHPERHTLSCMGDLGVGTLGAFLVQSRSSFIEWLQKCSTLFISSAYGLIALVFMFRQDYAKALPAIMPLERLVVALLFMFVVLEQTYARHSLFKLGQFKWISAWGQKTYGLYVLHPMAVIFFTACTRKLWFKFHISLGLLAAIDIIGALIFSLLLAHLSYRYFEQPFLRVKNKFSYINKS